MYFSPTAYGDRGFTSPDVISAHDVVRIIFAMQIDRCDRQCVFNSVVFDDTVAVTKVEQNRMPADGVVPFLDYLTLATVPDCELPAYYMIKGGAGRFFDTEAHLDAELERLTEQKGAELLIYEGPESEVVRAEAEVEVYALHVGRELQPMLRKLVETGVPIHALARGADSDPPRWEVHTGHEARPQRSLIEAANAIREACEKAVEIYRYKGLGEMNPSQLFESTMDPARRMLRQVVVSDVQEADRIFTVLMGPEVEPRRAFIERHALEATNIDI